MSDNRAVVVDPEAPGRLVIRPVAEPVPDRGEAVVRVRAISLNRGEVKRSGMAAAGWRPGWDLAVMMGLDDRVHEQDRQLIPRAPRRFRRRRG